MSNLTTIKPFPEHMITLLKQFGDLTSEFLNDLKLDLKYEEVKKDQEWLSKGQVCRKVIFLDEGFMYSNHEEENETTTTWFMKENDFVFTVESFVNQTPSEETIIALENTVGWYIT